MIYQNLVKLKHTVTRRLLWWFAEDQVHVQAVLLQLLGVGVGLVDRDRDHHPDPPTELNIDVQSSKMANCCAGWEHRRTYSFLLGIMSDKLSKNILKTFCFSLFLSEWTRYNFNLHGLMKED